MYKQGFKILSFAYFIIFAITSLLSQELTQENKPDKNGDNYLSFRDGYDAFNKGDYKLAKRIFRNIIKDMQFGLDFGKFLATSSSDSVLTAEQTGTNPTSGSHLIDVIQLATGIPRDTAWP